VKKTKGLLTQMVIYCTYINTDSMPCSYPASYYLSIISKKMRLLMGKQFLPLLLFFTLLSSKAYAGQIEISTYIPSPNGAYDKIRLIPIETQTGSCEVGSIYYDISMGLRSCIDDGDQDDIGVWTYADSIWLQEEKDIYLKENTEYPDQKIGIGTEYPQFKLSLETDAGIIAEGSYGQGEILDNALGGNMLIWYPRKAAFRVGEIESDQWDDENIGIGSAAFGYNVLASGDYSFSAGSYNSSDGESAISIGSRNNVIDDNIALGNLNTSSTLNTLLIGDSNTSLAEATINLGTITNTSELNAIAIGVDVTSSGSSSTAIGYLSTSSGISSTAIGSDNTASGEGSTALGYKTSAEDKYSTALGQETVASGQGSTAMGYKTLAEGAGSTAIGVESKALGNFSTAIGALTEAIGSFSVAMNYFTKASGISSVAMGYYTHAEGRGSISMGNQTNAKGDYSVALGDNTIAQSYASFVCGRYNEVLATANKTYWVLADPIFVVGNGQDETSRNNAFMIFKNGKTAINSNIMPDIGILLHVNGGVVVEGEVTAPIFLHCSTREIKQDIENISLKEAEDIFKHLDVVKFNFIKDKEKKEQLGFIAEDVPDIIQFHSHPNGYL